MEFSKNVRWPFVILVVIIILELAVIVYMVFLPTPFIEFDNKIVRPNKNFQYKSTITCRVLHSTHQKGFGLSLPWHEVEKFTLEELDSNQPKLETRYYSQPVALQKAFESDDYLTLEYAETSWETEVIGIMKKEGVFVRTMTGLQAGRSEFHYSIAQKGRCE